MGDPRRIKKTYDKPKHPWRAERLEEEKKIRREFGLSIKKEIWRAETTLRGFRRQARKLLALRTAQAEIEEKQLLDKLKRLNLVGDEATLDDILSLAIRDLLGRRLQTLVHKKGLASTPKQARQFIVHGHVTVAGKKVTSPGYMIRGEEEESIAYKPESPVAKQVETKKVTEKAKEAN